MIILGIDPGLAIVGYGVLKYESNKFSILDYGTIQTDANMPLTKRLHRVYLGVNQIIKRFSPDYISIEELFFYNNAKTAIAVGQARGVTLLACEQAGIPIYEYTPKQVKLAAVGYGLADKKQIQNMVKVILNLKEIPKPDDAADALAIAICHGNMIGPMQEINRLI